MKQATWCSMFLWTAVLGVGLTGCRSAYYAAYEKVGVSKRDLLKKRVVAARDEQKEAQQQFKDALTRLKHNLNAQAIASLKGEAASIQAEISRLIAEMNRSIARADEFVKGLS